MNELDDIWLAGIAVCVIKGYKFTATCMEHALYGGGTKLTYYNDSNILNEIRKSDEYKAKIKEFKDEYHRSGKRNFNDEGIDFTNSKIKDLYYSIQHATINAEVQDTGNLYLEISDVYDFDQIRTISQGISIGSLGNDLGYILQHWTDTLKKFDLVIKGYEWVGKRNNSSGGSLSDHSGSGSLGKSRIEKFVDIAESQIGYTEKYNNITKYGAWYGMQDEWCAMFVSWCANESGILGSVVPMYAYCPYGANWYIRKGLYRRRDSGYKPRRGDVIFFQKDGTICHTGIVTGYGNGIVYTVEGNASNRVKRNSYSLSNSYVSGFGVSDPSASGISISGSTLLRRGSRGYSVERLQKLLIGAGYSVGSYGADGVFGEGTYNAVIKFQRDHGLSQDGIVGPATWNAL